MKVHAQQRPARVQKQFAKFYLHFLVSITQPLWKRLILAGSFASVGIQDFGPNASCASETAAGLRTNTNHHSLGKKESASAWPIGMGVSLSECAVYAAADCGGVASSHLC